MKENKEGGLILALAPIIALVVMLSLNVYVFQDDASSGPNQLALLTAALVCGLIGVFRLKIPYARLEAKTFESVNVALPAVAILLVVGSLIGLWILNGVVPAMIYYGIKLINPAYFLPVALVICSMVSLATGSSWSTVGTVGIALIGIGSALGIPLGMVGGAIVSGSYFGDKISPLSETTNLAPAISGTKLFEHIQHMFYSTVPAYLLSFLGFLGLGLFYVGGQADTAEIDKVALFLESSFNLTPWLFTLPLLVFAIVWKKVPALPALAAGALLGGVYAVIFQGELIGGMLETPGVKGYYHLLLSTAFDGFSLNTGNPGVDSLLSRGGMSSMLNTLWLILVAMIFGGMMEATGMLRTIAEAILKLIRGATSLVGATIGSGVFLNLTTSDQYIAIVLTGRIFKEAYKEYGLEAKNLSRAVEDGATVTSVLVPWNTCGAYFASVMGVATVAYLPFAFFNLFTPAMSILLAATGWKMSRIEESSTDR